MIAALKYIKLAVLVVFSLVISVAARADISGRPKNLLSHLNNMTPYRAAANLKSSPLKYKNCTPVRFWSLLRHGTRNPNEKYYNHGIDLLLPLKDKIVEAHKSGTGNLHCSEIALFEKWEMPIGQGDLLMLKEEGALELQGLGQRFKERFPQLFCKKYDTSDFKFYHTPAARTHDSALNFAEGVFGTGAASKIQFADQQISNEVLKFYKTCKRYKTEVKAAKVEKAHFLNGDEIKSLKLRVTERLGIPELLEMDAITAMYTWCAFETAWSEYAKSPWCSVFTEEDLKVLEYVRDLNLYAKHGYRLEVVPKMMCPMIKNVFDFFNSDSGIPSVRFNFAHSNTILKFYTSLGLFKDPIPLEASNFDPNRNRQWRGSVIDTFAANIVFILYDCHGKQEVLTLHQEKPITLPGCPNAPALCPLKTIISIYKEAIYNCDLEAICN